MSTSPASNFEFLESHEDLLHADTKLEEVNKIFLRKGGGTLKEKNCVFSYFQGASEKWSIEKATCGN